MKKKLIGFFSLLLIIMLIGFILRYPILRSFASFLIVEDEIEYVAQGFVLSGGAFDRGNKAAELFLDGKIGQFVCTGANQSPDIMALGIDTLESDLTKLQMLKMGVPSNKIKLIKEGTSTQEESEIILEYALENQLQELVVISSKFHTRRVKQVFVNKFEKEGVTVLIQGASSSSFDEMKWWESEYGLIAINNEYLKQLYYLIKY